MILLDDYLFALFRKGIIAANECMDRSVDHGEMEKRMLTLSTSEDEEDGAPSDEF
jgi:hypothetical protein